MHLFVLGIYPNVEQIKNLEKKLNKQVTVTNRNKQLYA